MLLGDDLTKMFKNLHFLCMYKKIVSNLAIFCGKKGSWRFKNNFLLSNLPCLLFFTLRGKFHIHAGAFYTNKNSRNYYFGLLGSTATVNIV
jgi:hypothetical protein